MFAAVAHGMSLDFLALEAKGAYIPGLMRIRLTQKGAYTLVLCADFCSCWQEMPLHRLGSMASGLMLMGATGLYIFLQF